MQYYNTAKVELDGQVFDSLLEYDTYNALSTLSFESIDSQVPIELQPKFNYLGVSSNAPITYVMDFVVHSEKLPSLYVEAKGFATEKYNLKRKMLQYMQHPLMVVYPPNNKKKRLKFYEVKLPHTSKQRSKNKVKFIEPLTPEQLRENSIVISRKVEEIQRVYGRFLQYDNV